MLLDRTLQASSERALAHAASGAAFRQLAVDHDGRQRPDAQCASPPCYRILIRTADLDLAPWTRHFFDQRGGILTQRAARTKDLDVSFVSHCYHH